MSAADVSVEANNMITVTLQTMAGDMHSLNPLCDTILVGDLARSIREYLKVPIAAQNLIWDGQLLTDASLPLKDVFGIGPKSVELLVVQRPLTCAEKNELHVQLVRAIAVGNQSEFKELRMEGASVDPELPNDTDEEIEKADDTHASQMAEGDDDDFPGEKSKAHKRSIIYSCGITPLMMAIAAGDDVLTRELRQCGAAEPSMSPVHESLAKAFAGHDLLDVCRHLAAGADVDTRLRRGEGIQATGSGTPLHACCAMHREQGSYEVAQLLIRKKADLQAGDSEGDTALAHARYFGADGLFELLQGNGAMISGPYYRMFGRQ